jgi:1-acyl-sn-glycerol-3-phosphate acyltransferase
VAFLTLIARPIARLFTGADVIGSEHLPRRGPAIVAANHHSHVDTLLLLSIFSPRVVGKVRPVAAADYFLSNPITRWLSIRLAGITPISRAVTRGEDLLAPAKEALGRGEILLIFPEGTRGSREEMAPLKAGLTRLLEAHPQAPVIPVWIQGAGRVLPKGARVPVPMNCCVLVGEPMAWSGDRQAFMAELKARLEALGAEAPPLRWS